MAATSMFIVSPASADPAAQRLLTADPGGGTVGVTVAGVPGQTWDLAPGTTG
ncbi:hypothetical protein CLV40_11533 [Actinokineospora auranticolor]|uniref:Uncharacterized protein n=2 Tax=Actinokineospora auranticolor TaxID=155976 RepID=A0A2S6GJ54_9PSEU|nr:hypothetical protein CLV40_11533 [Actinokineospora auranticolor]